MISIVAMWLTAILFSLTRAHTSPHGAISQGTISRYCSALAIGNIVMNELYTMANLNYGEYAREARMILDSTNGLDESGCKQNLSKLENFIKLEMSRQRIPVDLIEDCPLDTLPYNLFLCKFETDIMDRIPNFCKSSCSQISEWNNYHQIRGITEFPDGWVQQLNNDKHMEVKSDVPGAPARYGDLEYARQFGNGVSMDKIGSYVRKKRQHGVLPKRVPRRFVQEFFNTNTLSIGNWTRQAKCLDDEWPFAIDDGLPYGITLHCWGPLGYAGNHTIGNITRSNVTQFDCNNVVEFKPPNGTFLIGMSNRVNYNETNFLVAGVFLCSGEEKWTAVKKSHFDTTNGTGEIVRCLPGTMFCTMELKMVRMGNDSVTTDVRVGCCEAPESLLYSSMTLVSHVQQRACGIHAIECVTVPMRDRLVQSGSVNWTKDFYAEPYGGFIREVSLDFFRDLASGGRFSNKITFSYSYFNNSTKFVWPDQNPTLTENYNRQGGNVSCDKGFVNGMEARQCLAGSSLRINCTNGKLFDIGCAVDGGCLGCKKESEYEFECPQNHLICGLRKSSDDKFMFEIFGYTYTYICCPVLHRASSICGPSGVLISLQDAKVTCIAVSGTDTKCTTTQTYGYRTGSEVSNGTTVDTATEESYGYSTTKKLEVVASSSATISAKVTVKNEVPGFGGAEAEAGSELSMGMMTTTGNETASSSTSTKSAAEGFSFNKAVTSEASVDTTTTTEYIIQDGQRAIFYDVVRTCGATQMTSEDFIRILTPSLKCDPHEEYEFLFGWQTDFFTSGRLNFTFFGFGLEIENDTFVSPLERAVNWDLISFGVKEKFTESIKLSDEVRLPKGGYDFKRAPIGLWRRATNKISYRYTFNIVNGWSYRFYRLVGRCGRWRAITNSIWAQRGIPDRYNITEAPPDPFTPFEMGQNFRIVEA